MTAPEPVLLIHGGAGAIQRGEATPEREAAIRADLAPEPPSTTVPVAPTTTGG